MIGHLPRPTARRQAGVLSVAALVAAGLVLVTLSACDDSPTAPTTCTLTIAPSSLSFASAGGAGTVGITASDGSCPWTATSSASWVTVSGATSGTGSGSVAYAVAANPTTMTRTATLTIDGQAHAISQQGQTPPDCTYALAPTGASFGDDGGPGSFDVAAPAGCPWTATSSQPWVVVTGGSPGSGDGSVTFDVAENNEVTDRTAAIIVADQVFSIQQSAEAVACSFSVAPVTFTPCMPGGLLTTTVTASSPTCAWTVSTNVPWLTLATGASGMGTGSIQFNVGSNYDAPRDGLVMVRWDTPTQGQNVQVQQAGCVYAVTQSSFAFAATGGASMFDVLQQSIPNSCGGALQDRCIWSATSTVPWIVVTTSMPRQGDDRVSFTVQSNATGSTRVGTIVVRDQVVQITQSG